MNEVAPMRITNDPTRKTLVYERHKSVYERYYNIICKFYNHRSVKNEYWRTHHYIKRWWNKDKNEIAFLKRRIAKLEEQ